MNTLHCDKLNSVGISTVVCGSFWGVEKNSKCPELIPDIEKFLPVAIFKMAATIPHIFNIVRFQRRVTCYDHFYVFQFFSILAVSMATAAILKKSTLYSTTSHDI
jgi:hypothetical protein